MFKIGILEIALVCAASEPLTRAQARDWSTYGDNGRPLHWSHMKIALIALLASFFFASHGQAAGTPEAGLSGCSLDTVEQLIKTGKLPEHYRTPEWYLRNCPMDQMKPDGTPLSPIKPGAICRGTAMGGGPFANDGRLGSQILPCGPGIVYYEADISPYACGNMKGGADKQGRGLQRVVYDNMGNVYVTDHYKTFDKATIVDGKVVLTPQAPAKACVTQVPPTVKPNVKTGPVCGNGGGMRCMANNPQVQAFGLQLGTCAIDDIEKGGWNGRCKIYFDNNGGGITLGGQAACEQWAKDPGSIKSCFGMAVGKTADAITLLPGAGPFCGEIFDIAFKFPDRIGECINGTPPPVPVAPPVPTTRRVWANDLPEKDSAAWNMGSHCGQGDGVHELVRDQGETYFSYTPKYNNCADCCAGESFADGTKLTDALAIHQCAYRCMRRCGDIPRSDSDSREKGCKMSEQFPWGRYEDVPVMTPESTFGRGDFSGDQGGGTDVGGDF